MSCTDCNVFISMTFWALILVLVAVVLATLGSIIALYWLSLAVVVCPEMFLRESDGEVRELLVEKSAVPVCTICATVAVDTMLQPCGHTQFCASCVRRMLGTKKECPVCRSAVHETVVAHF